MRAGWVIALGFLFAAGSALPAQSLGWRDGNGPHVGVDAFVGSPSARGDIFREVFFGASLRFIATAHIEISLDYAFMGTDYYYPQPGSGSWAGPVPWSSLPASFGAARDSWIFYQTRHFLAPQLWYVAPLERFGLPLAVRLGAGPAVSFVLPSEAAQYYPGLSDAYQQFSSSFKAYLGLSLRAGLEYRPWRVWRLGAEYLFIVDSLSDTAAELARDGIEYFNRAGSLLFFAGLRL
jgi:hypothetical protein